MSPHSASSADRGRDLDSRDEIREFAARFCRQIAQDARFHHYFDELASVDWRAHIEALTDFWCGILLGTPYDDTDSVIEQHRWLDARTPFDTALFDRWLEILREAIDGGWSGPMADRAEKRGLGVAWAMAHRLVDGDEWRPHRTATRRPG